jgi:hypothetical protein
MRFMQLIEAVELIQMEYAEMPELKLTFWQAQRLWNFSEELCERALTALISSGFLTRTADGAYVRRGSLASVRKASLSGSAGVIT